MKRLLFIAGLMIALSLPLARPAAATRCFEENYGGGSCGTTCVKYNDQGSVTEYTTVLHAC
jgi:hypothetical protein